MIVDSRQDLEVRHWQFDHERTAPARSSAQSSLEKIGITGSFSAHETHESRENEKPYGGSLCLKFRVFSRDSWAFLSGETRLDCFAEDVEKKFVGFLDPGSGIAPYEKIDIGQADGRPAVAPKQRNRF